VPGICATTAVSLSSTAPAAAVSLANAAECFPGAKLCLLNRVEVPADLAHGGVVLMHAAGCEAVLGWGCGTGWPISGCSALTQKHQMKSSSWQGAGEGLHWVSTVQAAATLNVGRMVWLC
jgi:uncharacterized lipoprotein YmbA